ncbi:MAG: hypothetical protein HKO57_15235, partial [Akkermansiaceae bacterium]|nr:hypothetical protein [Akkermansiaceae bacterium]
VFLDNDSDGAFTVGDTGEPNVLVKLYRDDNGNGIIDSEDPLINTKLTDGSGNYTFEFALVGDFLVEIDTDTLPASYTALSTDNLETATFTDYGNTETGNDFGYVTGASIGDTVWLDLDGDGTQDPGEPGIPGVTVDLSNGDSAVTGPDGKYLFGNLGAGSYTVTVDSGTLPAGVTQTGDPDATLDHATTVNVLGVEAYRDGDFGYQGSASIGDFVWFDADGDDFQDPGEPGLFNALVTLTWHGLDGNPGGGDDVTMTTFSDSQGAYDFTGLPAGNYSVDVDESRFPTLAVTSTDPQPVTGLTVGQDYDGADFGFDGTQPATKQLYLTDENTQGLDRNDPVAGSDATTSTSVLLGGVGTFTVRDEFALQAYDNQDGTNPWTTDWIETNDDNNPAAGLLYVDGSNHWLLLDHLDDSKDMESIERQADLSGATTATFSFDFLSVTDMNEDEIVIEASSNGGASYTQLELIPGTDFGSSGSKSYQLESFIALTNQVRIRFRFTDDKGFSDPGEYFAVDNVQIEYDGVPGSTSTSFTQTSSMAAPLVLPASGPVQLTTHLWITYGFMPYRPDITATVRYGATTVATLTDVVYADGKLVWNGVVSPGATVPAGQTLVLDITNNQPGVAYEILYDSIAAPSVLHLHTTSFINVDSLEVYDAAYPAGSSITSALPSDTVYVRLTVSDPFGADDITDVDLTIDDLGSGPVAVTLGAANVVASTAATKTYEYAWNVGNSVGTHTIAVSANEGTEGVVHTGQMNFELTGSSVSDRVWRDLDGDGQQDGGEPGLDGVTVRLLDPNAGFSVVATTTSAGGGVYSFLDLVPGDYVVEFVSPAGWIFSPQNAAADTVDSDADPVTGRTATINLAPG